MPKTTTEVKCRDCQLSWVKRADSVKAWDGRCRTCAQRFRAALPGEKEKRAEKARKQVLAQGGIPNAKKITPEMARGENSYTWKGGKPKCPTCDQELSTYATKQCRACLTGKPWHKRTIVIYSSAEMKKFRMAVMERDGYQCVFCGADSDLTVDHITPRTESIRLLYEISNGRTLCAPCHRKTPTNAGRQVSRLHKINKNRTSDGANWLITGAG